MLKKEYTFYVYILTNPNKSCLYVGFTNNLSRRLNEHAKNKGKPETWAGRYYCNILVYFEFYTYVDQAIAREKEIKKWSRKTKRKSDK